MNNYFVLYSPNSKSEPSLTTNGEIVFQRSQAKQEATLLKMKKPTLTESLLNDENTSPNKPSVEKKKPSAAFKRLKPLKLKENPTSPILDIILKESPVSSLSTLPQSDRDDSESLIIRTSDYHYERKTFVSEPKDIHSLSIPDLYQYVSSQIVGRNVFLNGAFGEKLKLYVDYAASGEDLYFMQDEMTKITELYSNTHTDASFVGSYMHNLLHQAEKMILKECKASVKDYFIISGGSGSTFGIEMAQKIFGTYLPPKVKEEIKHLLDPEGHIGHAGTFEDIKAKLRAKGILPLVITSSYEHHSNDITWRKQLCDIVLVPFRLDGFMDMDALEETLIKARVTQRPVICSFSAGSNVTGIKTDVFAIAKLCKIYDAVCLFDYAAVGTYLPIDLSQKDDRGRPLIDGIYLSTHKFLGGPGSTGLLILNREEYDGRLQPTHGGGGTVDYVGPSSEVYTLDFGEREKSGTPGILQIIRSALAFELKGLMQKGIAQKECENNQKFFDKLCINKNFSLLGPLDAEARVSIMSFNIWMKGPKGKRFIHHNLLVMLLSDIFGIQGRSGCACAAVYGHYLLNIDDQNSLKYKFFVETHPELNDTNQILSVKLGWARITLHYLLKPYELDYIIFALNYLCEHGSKFLPLYKMDACTGAWTHALKPWKTPILRIGEAKNEVRTYARNEEARRLIFEKQKAEALDLLRHLPESKGFDAIEELEGKCRFYVEKGNIVNRHCIEEKSVLFKNVYKETGELKL